MMVACLTNIVKSYPLPGRGEEIRVLDQVTLSIAEGETLAITGPSGSGKTTLLNILGTLDQPTSGEVVLNDQPVAGLDEPALARLRNRFTGFVFQRHHLLPQLTVIENVLLPVLAERRSRASADQTGRALMLLRRAGLESLVYRFPSQLSVGECQRAAVVRSLINKPRLILADEPTGSLDANNAESLVALLLELHKTEGFSMVMVTHDPAVADRMGRRFRLINGQLLPLSS
jgi:ABC-type lipoprotein export system ATPase subunit